MRAAGEEESGGAGPRPGGEQQPDEGARGSWPFLGARAPLRLLADIVSCCLGGGAQAALLRFSSDQASRPPAGRVLSPDGGRLLPPPGRPAGSAASGGHLRLREKAEGGSQPGRRETALPCLEQRPVTGAAPRSLGSRGRQRQADPPPPPPPLMSGTWPHFEKLVATIGAGGGGMGWFLGNSPVTRPALSGWFQDKGLGSTRFNSQSLRDRVTDY